MSSLEVTDVKVWPLRNLKPGSKLKANCRVTLNNSISINGKLWDGRNGLFVGADGNSGEKKNDQGQTEKVYYPAWSISREEEVLQESVKQAVIKAYDKAVGGTSDSNPSANINTNTNTNTNQVSHQSQNSMSNDFPF